MKTDNEVVAGFMGLNTSMYGSVLYILDEDGYVDFVDGGEPYWPDKSWNQLMPVVVKCKKLAKGKTLDPLPSIYNDIANALTECDIELVYKAVVEFVRFYNNQQNP